MNTDVYREASQRRGLSQRRVAQAADINPVTLSQILNRKMTPSVSIARRIADAVGASLDDLWPVQFRQNAQQYA